MTPYQEDYKNFEFVNNMVYAYFDGNYMKNPNKYQVKLWNSVKTDSGNITESTLTATVKNNTFVDVFAGTSSSVLDAFISCQKASSLDISNNLFYWFMSYSNDKSALYHIKEACTPTVTLTGNYFWNPNSNGKVYYYTTTSLVQNPAPEESATLKTVAINKTTESAIVSADDGYDVLPYGIFARGTSMISAGVGSDLDD